MSEYEKRSATERRTIGILQGHRSTLAFGLPWYKDAIAMVMGKVEQGSGMASIKNSLTETT
jgi:hypothetical protein